jgi:hypothetical protein
VSFFLSGLKSQGFNPDAIFCSPEDADAVQTLISRKVLLLIDRENFGSAVWTKLAIVATFSNRSGSTVTFDRPQRISRDCVIVSTLPIDDPCFNLLRMVVIFARARLSLASTLKEALHFLPTHVFLTADDLRAAADEVRHCVGERGLLWRSRFNAHYSWKKFWISCGSQSPMADAQSFTQVRCALGDDCGFVFCSGAIDRDTHELMTVVYGKPICCVFVPPEWGTLGFALRADIKFAKFRTVGGPIVPLVMISTQKT